MAQLCTARTIYNSYRNKDTLVWANQAIELHTRLSLRVDECITWQQMDQATDHFEVNIHIFDTSNIKPGPGFSFHYPQLCKAPLFSASRITFSLHIQN